MPPTLRRLRLRTAIIGLLTAVALHTTAEARGQAAKVVAAPGALLARANNAPKWRALGPGDDVPTGTSVLALFDAVLRSADGGVEAKLIADLGRRGPLPVLEAGVTLNDPGKHDLALRLDRGLVILTNTRPKGPATITLTIRATPIEVTLKEPKDRLAIEIYGRHAPGENHLTGKDDPVLYAFLIALHGEAFLKAHDRGIRLHAPPGPAVLVWDSVVREPEVRQLDKLPGYARPLDDDEKKALAKADALAAAIVAGNPAQALDRELASADPVERRVALTCAGAVDDLHRVLHALTASPHADTREFAILVLRHWLGRQPGQTRRLYDALTADMKLTEPQAKTMLQLLNGFPPEARTDPNTFDLLIECLGHGRPAIRELAHWHLVRLAPAGRSIPYDALAPEARRDDAVRQWRALVPAGRLPPAPKAEK
jgi:hypothetical protein